MKRLDLLEVVSVTSWFLMDICWMNGILDLGKIFAAISVFSMIAMVKFTPDIKLVASHITSLFWIMMNLFWMLSESESSEKLILLRNVFMVLGGASMIITLIVSKSIFIRRIK